ncbi:hypothetical protein GBA63_09200 [Rubrobacter tropicus]|uniref:Uncharacterized protein n=1 Tax=Rubrobacter tropicus TaxID=2653851 RepID=A0A6G8Q8Q6_9ACTN|nr:hypothetical protein [Rubrobacter tropicus]QIN82808.1 hypothetical protein GBA63_09200 [Rubrobacter tropicus]
MLEQLRRFWFWLSAQDPALNLDQRMARWVNSAAMAGFAVTGGTWIVGWAFDLPWFVGLLIGLVVWVVALNAFVSLGRRRHNRQMAALTGGRGILRMPTSEKFDELRQEVQEMKADLRQSEQERERLEAEKEARKDDTNSPVSQQEQPGREELKRDSRQMADDLRRFLKDNSGRSESEVMELYRDRLLYKVAALLEELEEQGLYPPEKLESFEISANAYPRSPMAIEHLAATLGTLGHRR